ncbi:MAG: Do family serine endopeptidase [Spirochaetes bacterium]|jgi:serine protease Do|nr:Do family serine endopeptidase [Spirochaetota bacterium]
MKKTLVTVLIILITAYMPVLNLFSASLEDLNKELEAVAAKVLPSVVSTIGESESSEPTRGLFGLPVPRQQKSAMGSGVIIDKRGYIVTNYHVIRNSPVIKIVLFDTKEYLCDVVGTDPPTDIAVLKIKGSVPAELPVIEVADSDKLAPGQIAIAVGNSFGLSHTVTMGIVSAINRNNLGLSDYENLIQTDAAINPGNSGGALVNIKGELIGINTAIYSRSGGSDGLGFAIPSNQVRAITEELIRSGKIVRGFLGVQVQQLTDEVAERLKVPKKSGVLVSGVIKGSPAAKAGLRQDDIIDKINGTAVATVSELRKQVAGLKPGITVTFILIRDGKSLSIKVTLTEMPMPELSGKKSVFPNQGMRVVSIDEDSSYKFGITEKYGAVVVDVQKDSPASRAGIIAGDLVQEVEGIPVRNSYEFEQVLAGRSNHSSIGLLVLRANVRRKIVVILDR